MSNINLDFDNIDDVMSVVHQTSIIMLDELLYHIRNSYEEARFIHSLDHLPKTLDECIKPYVDHHGLYKKNSPNPVLILGHVYGLYSKLQEDALVGEVTFNTREEIVAFIPVTDSSYYLALRYPRQVTRPIRFLTPTGDIETSWVTEIEYSYDRANAVKLSDIIKADQEKRLSWMLDKDYILYNFLEEAAICFIASLARYRNAKSLISSTVIENTFEANFPGVISQEIQEVLKDECFNILEPLYSQLGMAKVFVWSYYKVSLYGPTLHIDRLEDYRVVEWYRTMFEAQELKEYLAKNSHEGYR